MRVERKGKGEGEGEKKRKEEWKRRHQGKEIPSREKNREGKTGMTRQTVRRQAMEKKIILNFTFWFLALVQKKNTYGKCA
jgi:hypothetical protein